MSTILLGLAFVMAADEDPAQIMKLSAFQLIPDRNYGGYDLRLMSWGDGSGVPTSGSNVVIVGIDNNGLIHIRIFDASSKKVTDTDETKLPATQAGEVSALKQKIPGLLPPHVLTAAEKAELVREAPSIVGQIHYRPKRGDRAFLFSYDEEHDRVLPVTYARDAGSYVAYLAALRIKDDFGVEEVKKKKILEWENGSVFSVPVTGSIPSSTSVLVLSTETETHHRGKYDVIYYAQVRILEGPLTGKKVWVAQSDVVAKLIPNPNYVPPVERAADKDPAKIMKPSAVQFISDRNYRPKQGDRAVLFSYDELNDRVLPVTYARHNFDYVRYLNLLMIKDDFGVAELKKKTTFELKNGRFFRVPVMGSIPSSTSVLVSSTMTSSKNDFAVVRILEGPLTGEIVWVAQFDVAKLIPNPNYVAPVERLGLKAPAQKKPADANRAATLMKMAQNLEKQGAKKGAIEFYRQLAREVPDRPEAIEAKARLKILDPNNTVKE
jgi:hypothetical protein